MARKKKEPKTPSVRETFGLDKIHFSDRILPFLGLLLIAIAGFMAFAFISYFGTGAADQSILENPRAGEILNLNGEFTNSCGSLGAKVSWFFIKKCFGLPAFLIPFSPPCRHPHVADL